MSAPNLSSAKVSCELSEWREAPVPLILPPHFCPHCCMSKAAVNPDMGARVEDVSPAASSGSFRAWSSGGSARAWQVRPGPLHLKELGTGLKFGRLWMRDGPQAAITPWQRGPGRARHPAPPQCSGNRECGTQFWAPEGHFNNSAQAGVSLTL